MTATGIGAPALGAPASAVDRIAAASDHAIHHLVEYLTARRHRPQLMRLLADSPDWLIAKAHRLGGDQSVLQDLSLAIGSFADPLDFQDVLDLLRLYAVVAVVQQRASDNRQHAVDEVAAALVLASPSERFAALKSLWLALTDSPGSREKQASLLLAARDAADKMPSDWVSGQGRANALGWIVDELLALGEHLAALDTLKLMSHTIGDRGDVVVRIVLSNVRAGHLTSALQLLPEITNVWQRRRAEMPLARALWRARRHDDVLELASHARSAFSRISVLTAVIEAFDPDDVRARQKLIDDALEAGRTIPSHRPETDVDRDWDMKAEAIRALAHALASIGEFDRATAAAAEIPYAFDSALTFIEIGGFARRAGVEERARASLAEATAIMTQMRDAASRTKLALVMDAQLSRPLELAFRPVHVIRALVDEGRAQAALALAESATGGDRAELIEAARRPPAPLVSESTAQLATPQPTPRAVTAPVDHDDHRRFRRLEALEAVAGSLEKANVARASELRDEARRLRSDADRRSDGDEGYGANPIDHDRAVAEDVERAIIDRRWDDAIAAARRASTHVFGSMSRVAWSMIRTGEVDHGYQIAKTLDGSDTIGSVVALYAIGRLDLANELIDQGLRHDRGDTANFVQALAGEGLCLVARAVARKYLGQVIPDALMVDIAMCAAAKDDVEYAISVARAMRDQRDTDRVLQSVVARLQHAARSEDAAIWAETIVDPGRREAGLQGRPMLISGGASVDLWLNSGRFGYVRQCARSVASPDMRVGILAELSRAHAIVGELSSAVEVAREIPMGATQAVELRNLAVQFASHRRFDEAVEVAHDIGAAMARSLRCRGLPADRAEFAAQLSFTQLTGGIDNRPERINFPDQTVIALAAIATEMRAVGDPRASATVVEARTLSELHELSTDARIALGRALAALDRWCEGLRTMPPMEAHAFALEVHALGDTLEKIQPGLAIAATTAVGRIAGWVDDNWKDLAEG